METEETTQVETEEIEEENNTELNDTTDAKETKHTKSYVKIREEKAQQQIFKALGVKNIEEAKEKLNNADKALSKVQEIEKKLEAQETEKVYSAKVKELTRILDNEKVFDSDALVNYVDLDSFELKNGKISEEDAGEIIKSLKKVKPKFFGTETVKSDTYQKTEGTQKPLNDYSENYNNRNYVGVISQYLKNIKK